jgi:hypothetical protein
VKIQASAFLSLFFLIALVIPLIYAVFSLVRHKLKPKSTVSAGQAAWEAGFYSHYYNNVRPRLAPLEKERLRWMRNGAAALTINLLLALAMFTSSSGTVRFYGMGFIGFLPVTALLLRIGYTKRLKNAIVPAICAFFGENRLQYYKNSPGASLCMIEADKAARLLYEFGDKFVDDGFYGIRKGCEFLAIELSLSRNNGGKTRGCAFRGLVLGIMGARGISEQVVVRGDGKRPRDGNFKRVNLEDVSFEREFDAYGTDQIVSRKLLTPKMMERITKIAGRISNTGPDSEEKPEFAFLGNGFFLFIPSHRNWFEAGGIMTSVYKTDGVKAMIGDLVTAIELVDALIEEGLAPTEGEAGITKNPSPDAAQEQIFVEKSTASLVIKPDLTYEEFEKTKSAHVPKG